MIVVVSDGWDVGNIIVVFHVVVVVVAVIIKIEMQNTKYKKDSFENCLKTIIINKQETSHVTIY